MWFYKNKSRKDGLHSVCIVCFKIECANYYKKNSLKRLEYQRIYRKKNLIVVREKECIYRKKNKIMYAKKDERYRLKNPEKLYEKGRKYRRCHVDYFLNKMRERKLLMLGVSDGTVTLDAENDLFVKQGGKCDYCGVVLNGDKHLDHIIPISRGGMHVLNNIHWTCVYCNLSKGNRLECEWRCSDENA